MAAVSAFNYPPGSGNALAFIVWYAVFLAISVSLAFIYPYRWTWAISVSLVGFLTLEVLGSVAYYRLSSAPVTGGWYSLFVAALTLGPTFFILTLHLCTHRLLQILDHLTPMSIVGVPLRPATPRRYLGLCLGIESLSLLLQIIGVAYAGVKSRASATEGQAGFDLIAAAMAIQLVSVAVLLLALSDVAYTVTRDPQRALLPRSPPNAADTGDRAGDKEEDSRARAASPLVVSVVKRPAAFRAFLGGLIANTLMLGGRNFIRAIMSAGGVSGAAMRTAALVNSEAILLFIVILLFTVLHPVWTTVLVDKVVDQDSP